MKNDDKLDKFFKESLFEYKEELSVKDIDLFNQSIEKSRFYRFEPYRFNIYYASVLGLSFLLNVAMIFYCFNFISNQLISSQGPPEIINTQKSPDSMDRTKSDLSPKTVSNEINQIEKIRTFNSKKRVQSHTNSNTAVDAISGNVDSSNVNAKQIRPAVFSIADSSNQIIPIKRKYKKTVVIVQKDTIYQIDTLPAKSRKWKIF